MSRLLKIVRLKVGPVWVCGFIMPPHSPVILEPVMVKGCWSLPDRPRQESTDMSEEDALPSED